MPAVLQGSPDTSLYIVVSGELEVLRRDDAGRETAVGRLRPGALFGEYALRTGPQRTATVRSLDEALLCEIRRADVLPLLGAQPPVIAELSRLMVSRQLSLSARA